MRLKEGQTDTRGAVAATTLALLAGGLLVPGGTYLSSAFAALLSWLVFEGLTAWMARLGADSLPKLLRRVLGRILGGLIGLCLALLLLYVSALPLHAIAVDQARLADPGASFPVLLCYLLPCLLVLTLLGPETILRTSRLLWWLGPLATLLTLAYAAPQFRYYRLFPVLSGDLLTQTAAALPRFLLPLLALLTVGVKGAGGDSSPDNAAPSQTAPLAPSLRQTRRSGRIALALGIGLILAIQIGRALSYASAEYATPLYETVENARVNSPGLRLDRLLPFAWVIVALPGVAFQLSAAARLFCRSIALRDDRPVGALLVGLVGALTLLLFMAGCLPALPPEQYVYVRHIGIARGQELPLEVTLLISQAKPGTGEESAGALQVLSAEAHSLPEAAEVLAAAMPYQLNFSRASLLVFSRELAEGGQIPEISGSKRDLSPHVSLSVTQSDMAELFEGMLSESDPGLSKLTLNRKYSHERAGMTVAGNLTGLMESQQIRTFDMLCTLTNANTGQPQRDLVGDELQPYLAGALPIKSVLKTEDMGAAVFSGSKMVGLLSGAHTMLVQIGTGDFKSGRLPIPIENERQSFWLHSKGKPKVRLAGESATVTVRLEAKSEKPLQWSKNVLKQAIGTYLATEMTRIFEAAQAADADVFGIGRAAKRQCGVMGEWDSSAWRERFAGLRVSFSVDIAIVES